MTSLRGLWLALSVGIIANAVALGVAIWALVTVHDQAVEGQRARVTQCRREPVMRKIALAGVKYHLLTQTDLRKFDATKPEGCAKSWKWRSARSAHG